MGTRWSYDIVLPPGSRTAALAEVAIAAVEAVGGSFASPRDGLAMILPRDGDEEHISVDSLPGRLVQSDGVACDCWLPGNDYPETLVVAQSGPVGCDATEYFDAVSLSMYSGAPELAEFAERAFVGLAVATSALGGQLTRWWVGTTVPDDSAEAWLAAGQPPDWLSWLTIPRPPGGGALRSKCRVWRRLDGARARRWACDHDPRAAMGYPSCRSR